MFASQLIRILNTLPIHSSNETCALDADELKGNMKENQNGILFHVNSPPRYPLATGINEKDGFWNTPELECAMVVDSFTDVKGNELKKPLPQLPSEYFEKDMNLYTDKNVMECDLPELMVCYKESGSYHVVKDICVDEGIRVVEKIVLDNLKDNHERVVDPFPVNGDTSDDMMKESPEAELMEDGSRSLLGQDCVENAAAECGTKEKLDDILLMTDGKKDIGSSLPTNDHSDTESLIQDVSESSLRKDHEYAANESGTQQGTDMDLFNPGGIGKMKDDNDDEADLKCGSAVVNLSLEPNTDHGGAGDDGPGNQVQAHEDSMAAIDKLKDAPLAEELDSNSMPSVKVYRPLTSLKFLLKSSEFGVDDDSEELRDQTLAAELSEIPAVVSGTEVSSSGQASILLDNSEVESGNITFNFDAEKVAAVSEDESSKNCHDLLLESDDGSKNDHDLFLKSETLPIVDGNLENVTKASHVPIVDGNLEHVTKASQVQHAQGELSFSMAGPISGLVTDTGLNHDDVTSDYASMARLLQCGDGESSFSVGGPVSGPINYSGPIPFSGSISLRSESSTTSTRSFAFPVLSNEWNSSPVRMAKADRRHYRKHRGWRLGIPCCKF